MKWRIRGGLLLEKRVFSSNEIFRMRVLLRMVATSVQDNREALRGNRQNSKVLLFYLQILFKNL